MVSVNQKLERPNKLTLKQFNRPLTKRVENTKPTQDLTQTRNLLIFPTYKLLWTQYRMGKPTILTTTKYKRRLDLTEHAIIKPKCVSVCPSVSLYVCTCCLGERMDGFEAGWECEKTISTPTKVAITNSNYLLGLAKIELTSHDQIFTP